MKRAALAAALLVVATGAGAGQFTVGSGASVDLGTGSLDLGCADLTVGGSLSAGTSGFAQARASANSGPRTVQGSIGAKTMSAPAITGPAFP